MSSFASALAQVRQQQPPQPSASAPNFSDALAQVRQQASAGTTGGANNEGAIRRFLDPINDFGLSLAHSIAHPIETAEGMVMGPLRDFKQGVQEVRQGIRDRNLSEIEGGIGNAVPYIGRPTMRAANEMASGNIAGGLGRMTTVVGPLLMGGPSEGAYAGADALGLPEKLRASSESQYARLLNPTTKINKALTRDVVAPGLADRGIMASSLPKLAAKAEAGRIATGEALEDAYDRTITAANRPTPGRLALPPATTQVPLAPSAVVPSERIAYPAASRIEMQPTPLPKLLGPAQRLPESVPLHEATAIVDRPSIAQPAMRETGYQTSLYPYRPAYKIGAAMENVGPITLRTPSEANAVDRLTDMGNSASFVRPGRIEGVEHPVTRPLNVVRETEPAQGIWLRRPEEQPQPIIARPEQRLGAMGITPRKIYLSSPEEGPAPSAAPASPGGVINRPMAPSTAPQIERPLMATQPLVDSLEKLKGNFHVNGIPTNAAHIRQISDLQDMVRQHGDFLSMSDMRALRQALDREVSAGRKLPGRTAGENSLLGFKDHLANSIREEFGKAHPDIATLNAKYHFWKSLEDLIAAARERNVGRGMPLGDKILTGAEIVGGAAKYGAGGAGLGAALGFGLAKLFRSTAWNTMSAATKADLARAIASSEFGKASRIVNVALGTAAAESAGQPKNNEQR